MGSIFRSESMSLCQLFLSSEAAYNSISELGEVGLVQFRDLNPDVNLFQRKFVHKVRRCDEMERKLRYLETQMKKDDITLIDTGENPEAPQPREMIDLEATFEKLENEMMEVNSNAHTLRRNSLELTELLHVLRTTQLFFAEHEANSSFDSEQRDSEPNSSITQNLISTEEGKGSVQLGFVAGVTLRERLPMFERMLWRVCRGNVFIRQSEIMEVLEDPATVLSQTTDHRRRVLEAAAKHIRTWFIKVRKIKAIYHTLNMLNLDVTNKCLIAVCWIPNADLGLIRNALRKGTEKSGSSVEPIINCMETHLKPPTFHRNNKFTSAFQTLIDSYGVATYREVNPALYTTTTFPFLFAVMFGDAGHGLIMLMFSAWMVIREKALIAAKMKGEIWNIFFGGRYIILLMSLFSIYTGVIYNDIFSKSFNIFGSYWHIGNSTNATVENLWDWKELTLDPRERDIYGGDPYPVGFEPIWQISINKINFQNSYKMKISIIIGVVHMLFGISLSLVNHMFFRRTISILVEFIPQVIFLVALFGWLCVMTIIKWIMYGNGDEFDKVHDSSCAPSVLITFINMVLMKQDKIPDGSPCQLFFFDEQYTFQLVLLISAVICVPIMLVPKPFFARYEYNRKLRLQAARQEADSGETIAVITDEEEIEVFEFSEVFIEQAIHTIEFVLGSVSHTASYLRLWALSLAHGQLSEVLWNMVMAIGLKQDNNIVGSIMLFLIFTAWAALTVSILVLMEGLSAFLHTLRLHWVEFQSKFYKGEGYAFTPLTFKHIINYEEEDL